MVEDLTEKIMDIYWWLLMVSQSYDFYGSSMVSWLALLNGTLEKLTVGSSVGSLLDILVGP